MTRQISLAVLLRKMLMKDGGMVKTWMPVGGLAVEKTLLEWWVDVRWGRRSSPEVAAHHPALGSCCSRGD